MGTYNSDDVVIVSAVRSPIGTYGGQFKDIRAVPLGAPIMKDAVKRANIDPAVIDDIGWGCTIQRVTDEVNTGRVTAIKAGIPPEVTAFTIQRVCMSSMWAVASGMLAIRQGVNSVFLAGGVESMSTVPYTLDSLRWGARLQNVEARDALWDGVTRVGVGPAIGVTAENLAVKYGISREKQDELAYQSTQKALSAIKEGRFTEEICPIEIAGSRGKVKIIDKDEYPREETTLESLAKLKPVFKEGGTVTAGNACGLNDGAAAMIIMRKSRADELGVKPMARLIDYSLVGYDPDFMGYAPVPATEKLMGKTGLKLDDMGVIEIHEAFAAQYLACEQGLGLTKKRDIININGSGISLGHPAGATGVRIMLTALYEMRRRNSRYGLATICGGGGLGMAIAMEIL